jgi:asparagine synthase (glutamine-hydrolysing)
MCGICGIAHADPNRSVAPDTLQRMTDLLAHRGPDGAGAVMHEGVGLAHRRLSVIDVAGGAQPLANEDGRVWVTYNGEIYNFKSLRDQLQQRGHVFRTRCDTEVLVHLYEEHGDEFPRLLNGIFALGLHDRRRNRVLIVRDHLGVKPLFYGVRDETLVFASEIDAVLEGLDREPRVRSESLQEYLIFRYLAAPTTFVEDVHRLPPGHIGIWENGRLQLKAFWTPPATATVRVGLDEAVEELDRRLALAVDRQLMSDVPLGVFCSGGVDSGLVTAYAARVAGAGLNAYSVGFEAEHSGWDETELAADSARRAGADHHVLRTNAADFLAWTQRLASGGNEPLSHPNSVPLAQLSEFARRDVTVVLTGEGADEVFLGYPRYQIAGLHARISSVPGGVRSGVAALLGLLPSHRMQKLASLLPMSSADQSIFNSAFVSPELVGRLTGGSIDAALQSRRGLLAAAQTDHDAVATLSRYETLTYLVSALERLDRVSMAFGLEARVPLLDVELVEWAMTLDVKSKLAGGRNKAILKRLGDRSLSPRITRGPKSGFGLPLDDWFRRPEYAFILDRLGDPGHPAASHFDRPTLLAVLAEHRSGAANHGELIWLLANVSLWHDRSPSAAALSLT